VDAAYIVGVLLAKSPVVADTWWEILLSQLALSLDLMLATMLLKVVHRLLALHSTPNTGQLKGSYRDAQRLHLVLNTATWTLSAGLFVWAIVAAGLDADLSVLRQTKRIVSTFLYCFGFVTLTYFLCKLRGRRKSSMLFVSSTIQLVLYMFSYCVLLCVLFDFKWSHVPCFF